MVVRGARRRAAMIAGIGEMKDVYGVVPEGAFYAMLVVENVFGKKFGDRVISNAADSAEVLLAAAKVAVVSGTPFGAPDCVRLSYSLSMEDMLEGLNRIDAFVQSLE